MRRTKFSENADVCRTNRSKATSAIHVCVYVWVDDIGSPQPQVVHHFFSFSLLFISIRFCKATPYTHPHINTHVHCAREQKKATEADPRPFFSWQLLFLSGRKKTGQFCASCPVPYVRLFFLFFRFSFGLLIIFAFSSFFFFNVVVLYAVSFLSSFLLVERAAAACAIGVRSILFTSFHFLLFRH